MKLVIVVMILLYWECGVRMWVWLMQFCLVFMMLENIIIGIVVVRLMFLRMMVVDLLLSFKVYGLSILVVCLLIFWLMVELLVKVNMLMFGLDVSV